MNLCVKSPVLFNYLHDKGTKMTELTAAQLDEFKVRLKTMEKESRDKQQELQSSIRDYKESAADAIDQAAKINERNDMLAQSNHLDLKIRQIVKTLNNFDDYGFCKTCGEDIDIRRLDAQPATTECVHCKEIQEAKNARTRPSIG